MVKTVTHVHDVRQLRTSSAKPATSSSTAGVNTRRFGSQIGARATEFEGRRARIEFHEEQRVEFLNIYVDGIDSADDQRPEGGPGSR